jgi:peptidoglycan-associated lipoprotein
MKNVLRSTLVLGCALSLSACTHFFQSPAEVDSAAGASSSLQSATSSGAGQSPHFQGAAIQAQGVSKTTYYFSFDSNVISASDKASIKAHAHYLLKHPSSKVLVEGNTDPRGSREYNIALGERRANSVVNTLKSYGVSPRQIRATSYGSEKLAASGNAEADYQLDRRAKIVYWRR